MEGWKRTGRRCYKGLRKTGKGSARMPGTSKK